MTLTTAAEQQILSVRIPAVVPERPRCVCRDHSRYQAGCTGCREAIAAYKRWRTRQSAYGRLPKQVDPGPARQHLNEVMARHFLAPRQLAPLCGLSTGFLRQLALGTVQKITAENERKVLAIDPEDALAETPYGTISSRGASRRLRALAAIGYSSAYLAPLIGAPYSMVGRWRRRLAKTITITNHRRVAEVYRELHTRPGPCPTTAIMARRWKYAPPICWDGDEHLDAPEGRPRQFAQWLRLNPDPRARTGAA